MFPAITEKASGKNTAPSKWLACALAECLCIKSNCTISAAFSTVYSQLYRKRSGLVIVIVNSKSRGA